MAFNMDPLEFLNSLGPGIAPQDASGTSAPVASRPRSAGPGGLPGLLTGLGNSIVGRDGTTNGQNGAALSQMGDFDVDSFIESTLSDARGKNSNGLAESIGGLMRLIGLGG